MARQPLIYQQTVMRQLVAGQWVTTKIEIRKRRRNTVQLKRISRLSTHAMRAGRTFHEDIQEYTGFTDNEMQIFEAIVRAERISGDHLIPCAFINECELGFRFGLHGVLDLIARGMLTRWYHPEGYPAITLTPLCAYLLGLRLGEVVVRWYQTETQDIGNRYSRTRRRRIKIVRHDYEAFWIGAGIPEREYQRSVINPLERPLDTHINEIEDNIARKYVRDLETMELTDDKSQAFRILDIPVTPLRKPGRKGSCKPSRNGKRSAHPDL